MTDLEEVLTDSDSCNIASNVPTVSEDLTKTTVDEITDSVMTVVEKTVVDQSWKDIPHGRPKSGRLWKDPRPVGYSGYYFYVVNSKTKTTISVEDKKLSVIQEYRYT